MSALWDCNANLYLGHDNIVSADYSFLPVNIDKKMMQRSIFHLLHALLFVPVSHAFV
jgi:hypothetical protein